MVLSIITVGVEFLDYPMYLAGDVESSAFLFQVPSLSLIHISGEPFVPGGAASTYALVNDGRLRAIAAREGDYLRMETVFPQGIEGVAR